MNRCRHNPPCQRREYWGRGGAGVLFTCSEDGTVLLLLRAPGIGFMFSRGDDHDDGGNDTDDDDGEDGDDDVQAGVAKLSVK